MTTTTPFNTILVTGASRGIGLELVKQLLESNPNRIVYATSRSASEDLAQLQQQGSNANRLIIEQLDVNSDESIDKLVQKLKDQNVTLDVLVNNAGSAGTSLDPVTTVTRESVSSLLETNTLSPLIVAQKFYNAQLINTKHGLVANISSILGSIANASSYTSSYGAYGISKAALNMVTKLQSVTFTGVRALSIHPGWLKTRMGGEQAPLGVDVGVSGIVKVLDNFKDEQNGTFVQYDGTALSW